MQKLLIADSSESFTNKLAGELQAQFQVFTCSDGEKALELLSAYQPDILILNLMLPYVDGLTVLQESTFRPSMILAITMHMSAYVEQAVHMLDIDYTMVAPSPESVALRLRDLLKRYDTVSDSGDTHGWTVHHLHLLNVPTHLDGYRQLCVALPLYAKDPQQLMTKELYPAVAQLCGSKDGRTVEHSIRNAICAAWEHRDMAIWRKYFRPGPSGKLSCPSNKEFICRLAEMLIAGSGVL